METLSASLTFGSSPLARGAPARAGFPRVRQGLIPAGAGSTASWDWVVVGFSAHPRWRGEHLQADMRTVKQQGSSPLARGAHELERHFDALVRLIPAGAGSTRGQPRPVARSPAHPRWRGEHFSPSCRCQGLHGSSPLARGAQHGQRLGSHRHGLIPAGAGST